MTLQPAARPPSEDHPSFSTQQLFWIGLGASLLLTFLIWVSGERLNSVPLLPDQGSTWYLWKLPTPTFWTQATAWGGYLLHQLFMWGTIHYARTHVGRYSTGLHPINIIALVGNGLFIALHFVQSQIWYDGLAQNVSLLSAEASVVLLLVIVLLMENRRRGLFLGKRAPIRAEIVDFFRRYHGYVFAWAIAYTFWFHPMVNTPGHLVGFFYMFLLLFQGSLFYTRLHTHRWWTALLEVMVLVHGAMVVYMLRGTGVWAFVLGFLGIFMLTQLHGLKVPAWVRWAALGGYLLLVGIAFTERGPLVIRDILLIPVIEYVLVLILALLTGAGLWLCRRVRPSM